MTILGWTDIERKKECKGGRYYISTTNTDRMWEGAARDWRYHPVSGWWWGNTVLSSDPAMQRGGGVWAVASYCKVTAYVFRSRGLVLLAPPHSSPETLSALFSYMFSFPVSNTSIAFYSIYYPPTHTQTHLLWNLTHPSQFPTALYLFSLLLAMHQRSCGNCSVTPAVLWPWSWGSLLKPRGAPLPLPLQTGGTGQCAGLEGWTAGGLEASGANRGHRGHSHSKPSAPSSKVWGETGSCSWSRKGALVCRFLTKDTCSQPNRPAQTLWFSCHVIAYALFLCPTTTNRNYYICTAAHHNNI